MSTNEQKEMVITDLVEQIKKDFDEKKAPAWLKFVDSLSAKEKENLANVDLYNKMKTAYNHHGESVFGSWNDHLRPCLKHIGCFCVSRMKSELGGARGGMSVEFW